MSSISQEKGGKIEQEACVFLRKNGLLIRQQNYTRKTGEIDIIAADQQFLIFIEVRFRSNLRYGQPFQTINKAKQKRIINTAKLYLQSHPQLQQYNCRFYIISASIYNGELKIEWLKNAFQ